MNEFDNQHVDKTSWAWLNLLSQSEGVTPKGGVCQIVTYQTGTVATGTTNIPTDNTIPQNTEGDEYMTLAITPKYVNSTLEISIDFAGAVNGVSNWSVALFQDSTANALAAMTVTNPAANYNENISLHHLMTSGTTSATTFKVRAGPNTASTLTFNGNNAAQFFGGIMASRITIKEWKT